MIPTRLIALFACLLAVACATSPHGLKEQPSDFEHTIAGSTISSASECLLRQMEAYPVLAGFGFEDRTLPVQIRQFSDSTELFQMQNAYIATLIRLEKAASSKISVTLHVADGMITHDRVKTAFTGFIESCS